MRPTRVWTALLLAASGWGCVYYNAMWTAEHYAKDARRLETRGQESEARSQWALAATKAEAVVLRHPSSKWADDALVLQAEGHARSGACEEAQAAITRARKSVQDLAQRERIDLADAECALAAGHPIQADAALALPLASKDAGRRSRAEFLAGRSAVLRSDYSDAVAHFERSRETAARVARVRALLDAGRSAEAAAALDGVGEAPEFETQRADLLAQLAVVGGPEAASAALDRMLTRKRIQLIEQARLLSTDADRRLAHGEYDVAAERYRRATLIAPAGTTEAGTALTGRQRVLIAQARARGDLTPILAELTRLSTEPGGSSAKTLLDVLRHSTTTAETPGAAFRVAEIARDSLKAPALAGQLFLDVAARDTASLYAPKALLAALAVLPERRDSIAALLDSRYPTSPYTRAFHGEPSVAYAAAEDSLARELGVQIARSVTAPAGSRFDVPIPGPRGPQLDDSPTLQRGAVPPAVRRPGAPTPTRDRPAQPERP